MAAFILKIFPTSEFHLSFYFRNKLQWDFWLLRKLEINYIVWWMSGS